MNIIIIGPQGSGKGTQAKKLAKHFNLFYISTGDLLREMAKEDSKLDEKINIKGELLSDNEIFSIMTKFLKKQGKIDGIVFDGYPRSTPQYLMLKKWLEEKGENVDASLFLDISEKESIRRLSARRMDPETGKIYNLVTAPKPGSEVDKDSLIQREDDKPEAIKKRLDLYIKNTKPILDIFEKDKILVKVDGERPIDVIQKDLVEIVKGTVDK